MRRGELGQRDAQSSFALDLAQTGLLRAAACGWKLISSSAPPLPARRGGVTGAPPDGG